MKFQKASDIVLLDHSSKQLGALRVGYRAGPFTIHKDESMRNWNLSVGGVRLFGAWWLENAKKAARDLASLPIDWHASPKEIMRKVNNDPQLKKRVLEIRNTYDGTQKL